jgi:hypothetical protein
LPIPPVAKHQIVFGRDNVQGASEIKRLARSGDDLAISLLREMRGRLKLFESSGTGHSKYGATVQAAKQPGPTLVLTCYIHSAEAIAAAVSRNGIATNIVQRDESPRHRGRRDRCAPTPCRERSRRDLNDPPGVDYQLFCAVPRPVHNVWVHGRSIGDCLGAEAFDTPHL